MALSCHLFCRAGRLFPELCKDDVIPDAADIAPRDHIFLFMSEEATDTARPRNDQCPDLAGMGIKFNISHKAQPFAVTYIDDLAPFQLAYTHLRSPRRSVILLYAAAAAFVPIIGERFLTAEICDHLCKDLGAGQKLIDHCIFIRAMHIVFRFRHAGTERNTTL